MSQLIDKGTYDGGATIDDGVFPLGQERIQEGTRQHKQKG